MKFEAKAYIVIYEIKDHRNIKRSPCSKVNMPYSYHVYTYYADKQQSNMQKRNNCTAKNKVAFIFAQTH